ncbi:hypothetical protein ADL02_38160 [Streptomyces sp. NRRL WC-3723]|nr:hypothetical protein ADL02_38160 [Streptomyces sp. NRRL WC-3723]
MHEQFTRVCATRDWVAGLPQSVCASDSTEHRRRIQEEAVRHSNECHMVWDIAQKDIDSDEVRSAMAGLDQEVTTVLGQVAEGEFAPDLNRLQRSLDDLTAAAKHRLTTRLSPRTSPLTHLREERRNQTPP